MPDESDGLKGILFKYPGSSPVADDSLDYVDFILKDGSRSFSGNINAGTNNLTNVGTVDGRDVSADGTKLDGIEASADVTDAANVNAAGAVMESDTTWAKADGTRPSWVSGVVPGSPSDGQAWYRTAAPAKLFVYSGTDSRWYATESILVDFNRNGTASDTDWLGRHRINALSSTNRAMKFPFKIQIYSMAINSTTVAAATCSVDLRIDGSDEHTISWDASNNYIQEDINEVVAADTGFRCQVNVTGTAPANVQVILMCREYV